MDILQKFKSFQSRSKSAYAELYGRIREDRLFMSGEGQWTQGDNKFIAKTRNRVTVNVISNQCHSVANQYAAFPYTWYTGDQKIDHEIDQFFATDSNRFAPEETLLSSVSFGLGVFALGSDTDSQGNEVPVIYSVNDLDRVMLDPDSTELDGSDMMESALIDYRSREWIRVHMGEQYVPDERAKMLVSSASCATLVPIITYYWLDTDGCHTSTFVNETPVVNPDGTTDMLLPIKRIPIFPVWGEQTWDGDKRTYCGLVAKSKTIQRIVNYSMTQLIERLALSPKPQWQGYLEMFKGLDKYYKDAGAGGNPIVPSQRLANDGTTVLEMPKRLDNTVQFADVQGIVTSSLNMLSSITGVDSKGLPGLEDVTATAVLYTSKVFQNNIRHYFSHLRTSFKALGDCVMQMLGHTGITVDVAQGPDNYMEMQVARQELTSLASMAEPNQKRAIFNAILRTHPDNEILAQLYAELNANPAPTPMEQEMQNTVEMMKKAIEQKDAEILQLTAQVEQYRLSTESQDKSIYADMLKSKQAHEYKMEEMALQARLQGNTDALKAEAEAEKAAMGVEKEALSLETARQKNLAESLKNQQEITDRLFGGV